MKNEERIRLRRKKQKDRLEAKTRFLYLKFCGVDSPAKLFNKEAK